MKYDYAISVLLCDLHEEKRWLKYVNYDLSDSSLNASKNRIIELESAITILKREGEQK